MRDIKFRGKSTRNGKWYYGYYCRYDNGPDGIEHVIQYTGGYNNHIDPKTVGQHTGLKDKNGTEIYEGDILDWKINSSNDMYLGSGEVVYVEGAYWSCGRHLSEMVRYHQAEIIGNTYENPELLKEESK